jgi:amylosucrase
VRPRLAAEAEAALGPAEADAFVHRVEVSLNDVHGPLALLYGGDPAVVDELFERGLRIALAAAAERPEALRRLDRRREIDPGWFQRPGMQGYVCYVDRFCGTLDRPARAGWTTSPSLGTTYLHLDAAAPPRARARTTAAYAVTDYRPVDPGWHDGRPRGPSPCAARPRAWRLCIDLVLNHTARSTPWARAVAGRATRPAPASTPAFPGPVDARRYDATIPAVFPDRAPGSFSWVPEAVRRRRRLGVDDVLARTSGTSTTPTPRSRWRCSARSPGWPTAASTSSAWTPSPSCGSAWAPLPEPAGGHRLLQLLHALTRLAAPGRDLQGRGDRRPEDLVPYLGAHERYHPECELAYHNQLMVLLWSSLATGDAYLARQSLGRMEPIPPSTSWVTYVARTTTSAGRSATPTRPPSRSAASGTGVSSTTSSPAGSRGSYARGALFQENEATGDARISGSAASLCGIEEALGRNDDAALDRAVRRWSSSTR